MTFLDYILIYYCFIICLAIIAYFFDITPLWTQMGKNRIYICIQVPLWIFIYIVFTRKPL